MDPIPNTENIQFKEKFIERYSKLTDWEAFKKHSLCFLDRAIRVNTLKSSVKEAKKSIESKGWKLRPIPWCEEGFWIVHEERRDVGNLLEHHVGKIYVQEAASMIPPIVLNPQPGEIILDLCAAPGSKTTQIAALMKNQGLLIANDVSSDRLQALGINLQMCGATNTLITLGTGFRFIASVQYNRETNHSPARDIPANDANQISKISFARYKEGNFDRILVDAPCSATGTLMRSLKTILMWNPGMIRHLSKIQKRLLETAFNNLKPGGTLVYSTCTMEPEEDEGVISWFLENHPQAHLEEIKEKELPGLKRSPAVLEFEKEKFNPEVKKCLRIWPQDNDTEGFFVARIKKKE